jgi:hypothetical protein
MKTFCLAAVAIGATSAADAADRKATCAAHAGNAALHGCDPFCGYEAVQAGDETLCMPMGKTFAPLPAGIAAAETDEYCAIVAANRGCNNMCGFAWDAGAAKCSTAPGAGLQEAKFPSQVGRNTAADPIIGGQGAYRYQYMPDLLKAPAGASLTNCHGLVTDKDKNIYLTYQNDGKTDKNCLIKWAPDGTGGAFMTGGGTALCDGTPHGLKITTEDDGEQYLYHANNNQKLTKTTLDGTIVWQTNGNFPGMPPSGLKAYRPTWFATPPNTNYTYLCDGYGSNNVYAFGRSLLTSTFSFFYLFTTTPLVSPSHSSTCFANHQVRLRPAHRGVPEQDVGRPLPGEGPDAAARHLLHEPRLHV